MIASDAARGGRRIVELDRKKRLLLA